MAIFAIYPKESEKLDRTSVKECQLNLWMLPALFGRKKWIVEVGLLLRTSEGISGIDIALPFEVLGEPCDLAEHILNDHSIQRLLFTRESAYPENYIRIAKTSIVPGKQFTKLCLTFTKNVSQDKDSYLRLRIEVKDFGNRMQWRTSFGVSTAATLDFRVSDLRELSYSEQGHERSDSILEIGTFRLFIIMPLWLRYRLSSPSATYLRLIEGGGWEKYLCRKAHLGRTFSICQMVNSPVSREKPSRMYADYERHLIDSVTRILLIFVVLGCTETASMLVFFHFLKHNPHIGNELKMVKDRLQSTSLSALGIPIGGLAFYYGGKKLISGFKILLMGKFRLSRFLYFLDNICLGDPCFGHSKLK